MRKALIIAAICLLLAGCQTVSSDVQIRGIKDGVDSFLALLGQQGDCYNVTPPEISAATDYRVFKLRDTCQSYLLYAGQIYELGQYFGGFGIMDIKAWDFDGDGVQELVYTYSWGSGIHRSCVGYFDPDSLEHIELEYQYMNQDMLIAENDDGGYSLHHADVTAGEIGLIDFDLKPGQRLADLVYESGELCVVEKP